MTSSDLQLAFFKLIKERLPAHLSLPDELASLLGISADSAYRRIRGEKPLGIEELALLSRHYHISLDGLLGQQRGSFVFNGRFVGDEDLPFKDWLAGMTTQLDQLAAARDPVFIFRAEDIPSFHYFQVPELTQFKLFFWRRTILNTPAFQQRKFSLADREDDLLAMARKTFLTYMRLPSTEIWNADSLNAFLRQITFYRDAGVFADENDAEVLFTKLMGLVDHLQRQAEAGSKFALGEVIRPGGPPFRVFINEVMMGDNMIYASVGGTRMVFLNHSAINYVSSMNEELCEHTFNSIGNIMKKSILISGVGERERNRYFMELREAVKRRMAAPATTV